MTLTTLFSARAAEAQGQVSVSEFLTLDRDYAPYLNKSEPLKTDDLIALSLLASGVSPKLINDYYVRMQVVLKQIADNDAVFVKNNPRAQDAERAEQVLQYLHKNVFKRYQYNTTTIQDILDVGVFNCVSSAVFYMIALSNLDIFVRGVKTPQHAFAEVRSGKRKIDVETTNRYGFDPGTKKEFKSGNVSGFNYVPPGNYSERTEISQQELIALILSNRVVFLEEAHNYEDGVPLAIAYSALVRTAEGASFLADRIGNYVSELNQRGRYKDARIVAELAYQKGQIKQARWKEYLVMSYNNEAVYYLRKGDYPSVSRLAQEGIARLGPEPKLKDLLSASATNRIAVALNVRAYDQARAIATQEYQLQNIDSKLWQTTMENSYNNEAIDFARRTGNWLGAAAIARQGLQKLGTSPALVRSIRVFEDNYATSVHNEFASYYNGGDYARAEQIVLAGLHNLPAGHPLLLRDAAAVRNASSAQ